MVSFSFFDFRSMIYYDYKSGLSHRQCHERLNSALGNVHRDFHQLPISIESFPVVGICLETKREPVDR